MRNTLLRLELSIFFVMIAVFTAVNTTAQTKTTIVDFETRVHNFGNIDESAGDVSCTFKFKNIGSVPFVITSIEVTCGCTSPVWDKAPVLPGREGEITVTFDPIGRPGVFEKSINVVGNVSVGSIQLKLTGIVNPRPRTILDDYPFMVGGGLRIAERSLSMGNITRGEASFTSLPIANHSDKPIEVGTYAVQLPDYVTVTPKTVTLAPHQRSEINIKLDASKIDKWGQIELSFGLTVNGIRENSLVVARAILVENFKILTKQQMRTAPVSDYSSYFYHFSEQPRGAKLVHDFHVSNSGIDDLIIRHLDFDSSKLEVKSDKTVIKTGQTATLHITLKSGGQIGAVSGIVRVITNDPERPVRDLRVIATMK